MRGSRVLAGWLALALVAGGGGHARAQSAPDLEHAKLLYELATEAMATGRYDDAASDYRQAYALTKDPIMFFKIASANEKAGKCDLALAYYRRYLHEANPPQKYIDLTTERMAACGASAEPAAGSAAPQPPQPQPPQPPPETAGSDEAPVAAGSDQGQGAGSAIATVAGAHGRVRGKDVPWLMVGGALAFITVGAVLAYSASSSENDIRDLYAGVDNVPVTYDQSTAQRYQQLIDQGHRYEYLSWASFGVSAGFAAAAAFFFVHEGHEHRADERGLTVAPIASPQSAGVSATLRF